MKAKAVFPSEIQEQVRKGYILRLDQRIKKMRKLFAERSWEEFKGECIHLKKTAAQFGLPEVGELAEKVELTLASAGSGKTVVMNRAQIFPEAKQAAENLFSEIYKTLSMENPS